MIKKMNKKFDKLEKEDNFIVKDEYKVKTSGAQDSFSSGAKRDSRAGKGRFDLISPFALKEIAQVYEAGAKEYGDRNWEKGMPLSRVLDSALRHICQVFEGKDDENHIAHAGWNILAFIHIRELIKRGILPESLDDLPNYHMEKKDV